MNTGSFLSVYKVEELHTRQLFAAKVPHFNSSDGPDRVRTQWEFIIKEFIIKEFDSIIKLHHISNTPKPKTEY